MPDRPGVRFSFSPRILPSLSTSASVTRLASVLVSSKVSAPASAVAGSAVQPWSVTLTAIFLAPALAASSELPQPVRTRQAAAAAATAAVVRRAAVMSSVPLG